MPPTISLQNNQQASKTKTKECTIGQFLPKWLLSSNTIKQHTDLSKETTVFNSAKVHLYQGFGTQWCLSQGT